MAAPVEHKVTASGTGALSGSITAEFVLYLLSQHIYHGSDVPAPVSLFVVGLCATAGSVVLGWLAPHTLRTPPDPLPVQQPTDAEPARALSGPARVVLEEGGA